VDSISDGATAVTLHLPPEAVTFSVTVVIIVEVPLYALLAAMRWVAATIATTEGDGAPIAIPLDSVWDSVSFGLAVDDAPM
jgi:hypothetical protein